MEAVRTLLRSVPPDQVGLARADTTEEAESALVSPMDRRVGPPPGRRRRRIALAAVIVATVALAAVAYVRFGLTRVAAVNADRIVVATVSSGMFEEYIPATASVVPRTTAYLDAVEGGQVAEVLVEEGALVHQGQPLVRLKNTNLQLEVLGRQAQLMEQLDRLNATILTYEQARLGHERDRIETAAQIAQLSQRLRRRKALQPSGAVSPADVDEVAIDLGRYRQQAAAIEEAAGVDRKFQREQVAQLRAAVETIQKNLAMAGDTLGNLLVKAPLTVQLTALEAHLGEAKAPGQRIGQIDRVDDYKVEAAIDEFYLNRVAVGQLATVDMDGSTYNLTLAKVYPQIRDRQFKVDLLFANPGEKSVQATPKSLRRGQSLQIRLQIGASRRTLVVANGAFYDDTNGAWAFVLSSDGADARRRAITLGRRNPQQIEVLAGLAAGDRLITSSYQALRRFDRIQIRGHADSGGSP
jgi:HlyD family secretion protein